MKSSNDCLVTDLRAPNIVGSRNCDEFLDNRFWRLRFGWAGVSLGGRCGFWGVGLGLGGRGAGVVGSRSLSILVWGLFSCTSIVISSSISLADALTGVMVVCLLAKYDV